MKQSEQVSAGNPASTILSPTPVKPALRRRIKRGLLLLALVGLGFAIVVGLQHRWSEPDPVGFDPAQMGKLEAEMWRSYYDGRWLRLADQTLRLSCGQLGFSWWDGTRLAWHAAWAAYYFRHSTQDPRALPALEKYYQIVANSLNRDIDTHEAALMELQWWRDRRDHVETPGIARTIANLSAHVYGVDADLLYPPALRRTEAMEYRDARRRGQMTPEDWREVTRQLTEAYQVLQEVLTDE